MKESALTVSDIVVGATYEGKRRREVLGFSNDRTVLWISPFGDRVQYDSATVKDGGRYPTIPMDTFLNWARRRHPDPEAKP